ncbi:putative RNA methyltransferase TK0422/Sfm1 [Septoria linicola]|nr:putative RNA methyltransferase TK0422/Sfm1 [Septoria linicola]
MSKHTFIVEHLDPELEDWQALEYNTISEESAAVGSKFLLSGLTPEFEKFEKLTIPKSDRTERTVESIYPSAEERSKVCLLDPKAEKDLSPEDGAQFDAFLFGGILGDDPPRDRTGDLRKLGFPGRRLGPEQMTTDTAVRTTRIVVQEGKKLDEIEYVDRPEIPITDEHGNVKPNETIEMPFKYVKGTDGKPIIPKGMLELLANDAEKDILDLL